MLERPQPVFTEPPPRLPFEVFLFGAVLAVCAVCLWAAVNDPANAQRPEPRVALVQAADWSRDGVYIWTDQGGCQYVVVARYQNVSVTPRMVRSRALSGGRDQAGCR